MTLCLNKGDGDGGKSQYGDRSVAWRVKPIDRKCDFNFPGARLYCAFNILFELFNTHR